MRTGDVDGLSRLDFEFALRADDLAHELHADQLPHATNSVNEQQFDENCWKGYHKEGMKKMFGKTVPNCVKNESQNSCPECGGAMYPESMINEKKDACYYKVKSRYKVWPSAYASGALVQCRKKGAANWGNKSESVKEGKHCDAKNAVPELRAALEKRKSELKVADADTAYDKIDKIMTRIAKTYNISGQELHDMWTDRYGEIPDTWVLDEGKITNAALVAMLATVLSSGNAHADFNYPQQKEPSAAAKAIGIARTINNMKGYGPEAAQAEAQQELMNLLRALGNQGNNNSRIYPLIKDMVKTPGPLPTTVQELPPLMDEPTNENFADGKGPGRAGDSQRHGIPKGATMAQLEKAAKAPGRKGQLARWQINMRRGKKK